MTQPTSTVADKDRRFLRRIHAVLAIGVGIVYLLAPAALAQSPTLAAINDLFRIVELPISAFYVLLIVGGVLTIPELIRPLRRYGFTYMAGHTILLACYTALAVAGAEALLAGQNKLPSGIVVYGALAIIHGRWVFRSVTERNRQTAT